MTAQTLSIFLLPGWMAIVMIVDCLSTVYEINNTTRVIIPMIYLIIGTIYLLWKNGNENGW